MRSRNILAAILSRRSVFKNARLLDDGDMRVIDGGILRSINSGEIPVVQGLIPNQWTQEGDLYSYQFPADTFIGTNLVYTASLRRRTKNRSFNSGEDIDWLDFNAATRTFSGTPNGYDQTGTWQIEVFAVNADTLQVTSTSFVLTVGSVDFMGTGKPVVKPNQTFDHTITSANIDAYNWASVEAGDYVLIEASVGNPSAGNTTEIDTIRTAGAIICWEILNSNKATLDFTKVEGGDTLGIGETINNWEPTNIAGTKGNEVYITNLYANQTINNGVLNKVGLRLGSGCNDIIVVGQGVGSDAYGLKVTSTQQPAFQIKDGTGRRGWEVAYVEVPGTYGIGFHFKTDTTSELGFRPDYDWEDLKVHDCYIHDCTNPGGASGTGGEGMYIGNGFYPGNNTTSSPTIMYPHDIRHVRVWHNIVINSGWDGIQIRNVVEDLKVKYNYVRASGIGGPAGLPSSAQANGIDFGHGNCDVECAYNWVEDFYARGIWIGFSGNYSIHHNVVIGKTSNVNAFNCFFARKTTGYNADGSTISGDNAFVTTGYGGTGAKPETAHTSRPDLLEVNLSATVYNNTFYDCASTVDILTDIPNIAFKNNLMVNCGGTTFTLSGTGAKDSSNNIGLNGIDPATIFEDAANSDLRILAASDADGAGVDVGLTKDYSGTTISGPDYAVGAFEVGAAINEDMYNFLS